MALGAPEKEKKWILGGETWRNSTLQKKKKKSAGTMNKNRQTAKKKPTTRIQVLS